MREEGTGAVPLPSAPSSARPQPPFHLPPRPRPMQQQHAVARGSLWGAVAADPQRASWENSPPGQHH